MTPQDRALKMIGEALALLADTAAATTHTVTVTASATFGWSPERFAAAPDATQIDVTDLTACLKLTRSAVYKLIKRSSLPCRRILTSGGKAVALVFTIGDVKLWQDRRQEVVNPLPRPRRLP